MSLDARLLEILACPVDKLGLLYFVDENRLYNPRLRKSYRVHEGIPVMLPDEASDLEEEEHDRLMQKAQSEGLTLTFGD